MTVPTASRFKRYLTVVLRWLLIAFVVFVLTILGGVYVIDNILHKVYTASAQIQLRPNGPGSLALDPAGFQAEFSIMQSADVLMPIITDLQLDKIWAKHFSKPGLDALPPQDAVAYMNKILRLDVVRGTNIINITVSSSNPKECADIANAVADRYKTIRDVEEDQRANRGADALRDQIAQQQKVVDEKKEAVEKIRQQLGSKGIEIPNSPNETTEQEESDLEARQKDLLAAKEDYDARQVLLKSVINLPDDQFISTLNGLGRDVKIVSDPAHPPVKEQIAGLRRAMQVDTDMAKSRVALLQKEVDDLTKKTQETTTSVLAPFRNAQRELQQQQAILDALNVRLKQTVADDHLMESPVRIISRAEMPESPSKPNKTLDFILTILAAGFLSVMTASFVEIILLLSRASERTDN